VRVDKVVKDRMNNVRIAVEVQKACDGGNAKRIAAAFKMKS